MTDKLSLSTLTSLQNELTALSQINSNNATLVAAFDNTLSRDGTTPNQMGASLDMNSNRIINLPTPLSDNEPLRLVDYLNMEAGQSLLEEETSVAAYSDLNVLSASVDLNVLGDTVLPIYSVTNYPHVLVWQILARNSGTVASLTTAQCSMYTGANGGGTTLLGTTALSSLISNTANTAGNMVILVPDNTAALDSSVTNVYFRVTQVQSAGASIAITVLIRHIL